MSRLKLISATDTQYSGSLLKSVNEQRNVGLFCDVTIIVNDRKFKAHRNILSASSAYFHELFSATGQVIELNFVRAEIFEEILNYIYCSRIIRVRSDLLEELIAAGRALGVKFIANLGVPLSLIRGLPGFSKDKEEDVKAAQGNNDLTSQAGSACMPIVTDEFSLTAEEFVQTDGSGNLDNSDVLFVSKQEPQNLGVSSSMSLTPESSEVTDRGGSSVEMDEVPKEKKGTSSESSAAGTKEDGETEKKTDTPPAETLEGGVLKSSLHSSTSTSLPTPIESPDTTINVPPSPASSSSLCSTPATPAQTNCSPTKSPSSSLPKENQEVLGVQQKHLNAVLEKSKAPPADFKIKVADGRSSSSTKNGARLNSPKAITAVKKTITLDKASEIDSLSTGCKVYANIGENTYDIVPMKEDPGEGDSKASRGRKAPMTPPFSPEMSPHSPRGASSKKKAKVEQDDHYELIMDGKTFYVCIVCKRPYVCLTSLRRHFNTHSWEKKYPCHYCDKVFALAEYRTKHEVYHTGERRYQCLLCNEFFINYQLLSSHCKQVHNQDPSGRKEKDDTNNNLYRLLPCKTVQFKPYSYVTDNSGGIPVINEEGIVYHVDPAKEPMAAPGPHPPNQGKAVNWDDIFVEPGAHVQQPEPLPQRPETHTNPTERSSDFDFVIPETY
ncbi:transcriptional regulator Kaiso [Megalops cyprinoides]|uniref:transcriptional regulator Kaiso n=1 Tax=Megalops cyprinoides TaxID=118141 RepID=UPI001864C0B9|nr:transcriptional regulator Kaiso [Megalops cyprinoides]